LKKIADHFTARGFAVLTVPEAPTIVAKGGGMNDFAKYTSQDNMHFTIYLMQLKIYL
jgi:hypothetical protein